MKTIKFFALLCLVAMPFAITSCSSDDDGGGGGSAGANTIKAKVDGSWVTTVPVTGAAYHFGSMLSIQGATAGTSSKSFLLTIHSYDGVGTYYIGGGATGLGQAGAGYTEFNIDISNPTDIEEKTWQAPYEGGDQVGEIKVSEVTDTYVKGTFHFTAKNSDDGTTKTVTEGSFNMEF